LHNSKRSQLTSKSKSKNNHEQFATTQLPSFLFPKYNQKPTISGII